MLAATNPIISSAEQVALIRYAVLLDLENRSGGIASRGLSEGGQDDLRFVFPRTSRLAAIQHASAVACSIFDDRVVDVGVYHVFRLPAYWERQIHNAYLEGDILNNPDTVAPLSVLGIVSKEKPEPSKAFEGPRALGEIHLNHTKTLRKLASLHADAIAAEKVVIPYFQLA